LHGKEMGEGGGRKRGWGGT